MVVVKKYEPTGLDKFEFGTQWHVLCPNKQSFYVYVQTSQDQARPTWEFYGYFLLEESENAAEYIKKKIEKIRQEANSVCNS